MLKKCSQHFQKNVDEKNTDNSLKSINKKSQSAWVFGPESVKWVVLGFVVFYSSLAYPPSGSEIGAPFNIHRRR
jgi:hypothetical protein